MRIFREPTAAASKTYDLIIVGGGIYGVMLSLAAARRGLSPLLLERDDFGGATSFNSLRIIHGGFRYLQTLDLPRFFESVRERRWFLQTFPELVEPLPCLMPLYGNGIRRPAILRAALLLNDMLACDRNHQVRSDRWLPDGSIINAEQVQRYFPLVDTDHLQGGAIWYDASLPNSQRLVMTVLRWACALGATALNYVEAKELVQTNGRVIGVSAVDLIHGTSHDYNASVVVNAAGPWCRQLASSFDRDLPELFQASIAWNVLWDRPALSNHALAVAPKKAGARTYFLRPWKGMLLAGTVHHSWSDGIVHNPMPTPDEIAECVADLNAAIPEIDLKQSEILHIFSGLLPVTEAHSINLSSREVILNHAQHDGTQGLYSISGVKFTTSRLVAEKTIRKIFSDATYSKTTEPPKELQAQRGVFEYGWYPSGHDLDWQEELRPIIDEESVHHLDDLMWRRTSLGDNPKRALTIAPTVCQLFDWDDDRCKQEITRLESVYRRGI